jgi:hypothetical protein
MRMGPVRADGETQSGYRPRYAMYSLKMATASGQERTLATIPPRAVQGLAALTLGERLQL